MNQKPARTLKIGNSTIHIIAPKNKSQEEIRKIMIDFHQAGWKIFEEIMDKEKQND